MDYADISWDDTTPLSKQFNDRYFIQGKGLDESDYVFLRGNQLPQRWQKKQDFVIGETGFGTGLNFLAAWALWQKTADKTSRLHYISAEKYPLHIDDLKKALANFPELECFTSALILQYPLPFPGAHRCHFANVTLTLLFGDAIQQFSKLPMQVDAWFLDGFSPRSNPAMWSSELFSVIAQKSVANATFSTFTSSGMVRRGMQAAGFTVNKIKGFDTKREMLQGHYYEGPSLSSSIDPWYALPKQRKVGRVAVIGAGIAGCSIAHAFSSRGFAVTVFEKATHCGAGASGNPLGIINGKLSVDHNLQDQLITQGALYCHRYLATHNSINHIACGMLLLARNEALKQRFERMIKQRNLPSECLDYVDSKEASYIAGMKLSNNALWMPWVTLCDPRQLCSSLLDSINTTLLYDHNIESLSYENEQWALVDQTKKVYEYDTVVVANSHSAIGILPDIDLLLKPTPGQISYVESALSNKQLNTIVGFDGYLTPLFNGCQVMGASYRLQGCLGGRQEEHIELMEKLNEFEPSLATYLQVPTQGRVSVRATTQDHMPMVGALANKSDFLSAYERLKHGDRRFKYSQATYHPGLYVSLGHGSHGLSTAMLSAEIIACLAAGEPLPVSSDLYHAIHPSRFWLRQL